MALRSAIEKDTRRLGIRERLLDGESRERQEGVGTYSSSPNLRVRTTSSWPGVSWSYGPLV